MDYKKKYEELYERISNLIRDYDCVSGLIDVREELKSILNESQESEDEKVKKAIGYAIGQSTNSDSTLINGVSSEEAIDWLEKQGEQNIKMIQWKGDNLRKVVEFTGKSSKFNEWFKTWDDYENYVHSHGNIFKLFCEDGSHYEVPVGAWIVKTPDGYNVASKATYVKKLSNNQSCFIIDKKLQNEVIERLKYLNYWVCGGNDDIINKLKHLKPQSCCKPSDEQKPTDKVEPTFKVGDIIRPKGSTAEYTIESIFGDCYHGKGWGLHISCDDDYELVEQNPTNKIEPKFKVGDTIVEKDLDEWGCGTIVNIKDGKYIFDDGCFVRIKEQERWQLVNGPKFKVGDWIISSEGTLRHIVAVDKTGYETNEGWLTHDDYEKNFHLWTIQDAKDGDVLTCYGNVKGKTIEQTGIFKEYVGRHGGCSNSFMVYIGVDWDDNIRISGYMGSTDIFPSTKEQRDLLFAKMKEAGYEWDAEKKELKKIEEKFIDKIVDCEKPLLEKFKQAVYDCAWGKVTCKVKGESQEEYANRWAKQLLILVRDWADDYIDSREDAIRRRSFDKGKQSIQNPAWSEEDEEMFDAIIADIQFTQKAHTHEVNQMVYEREIDWLKSLKERMKGK